MSVKRTALLALVFGLLASSFFALEGFSTAPPAPEWERAEKILACGPEDPSRLRLETGDGSLSAERDGENWRVTEPAAVPVRAADAVADLAQALCRLPIIDRIDAPPSLADFGLEAPRIEVQVTIAGRPVVVLFGEPTPAQNLMYVKLADEPRVLKVGVLLGHEAAKVAAHVPKRTS